MDSVLPGKGPRICLGIVLRGDIQGIRIEEEWTSVQDGSVLHVSGDFSVLLKRM